MIIDVESNVDNIGRTIRLLSEYQNNEKYK